MSDVAVGDFNEDGRSDLCGVNPTGNTLYVVLSRLDGTYAGAANYNTGGTPLGVSVGDLNGDLHLDIGVANSASNTVSTWLGDGSGQFQLRSSFEPAGSGPRALTFADLNGDNKLDLIVANATGQSVTVSLGNGDGTFTFIAEYSIGSQAQAVSAGRINSDPRTDVAVLTVTSLTLVLLGNGNGTLGTQLGTATTNGVDITLGDFDSDGHLARTIHERQG